MKNILILFWASSIIFFNTQAMFLKQLSLLEKQLIQKKIKKHGPEKLRTKIDPHPNTIINANLNPEKLAIVFTLAEIFYRKEAATNPWVEKIFNTIEKIEKKSGYIPNSITKNLRNGYKVTHATNYVGPYTRYYRLKGKEECVLITSEFYNKAAILKLIDTYKE